MPSTRRLDLWALLIPGLLTLLLLAGCGGGSRHASAPTTTLLETDVWTAPVVTGPPSSQSFCTVLVAMYSHQSSLPLAAPVVKEQILSDFTATVPEALASAPPDIAPAARTYLTTLTGVLNALVKGGLDYKKVPAGTLTPLLLDPNIKAAGTQVLDYSRSVCHYAIGGAPTQP